MQWCPLKQEPHVGLSPHDFKEMVNLTFVANLVGGTKRGRNVKLLEVHVGTLFFLKVPAEVYIK